MLPKAINQLVGNKEGAKKGVYYMKDP